MGGMPMGGGGEDAVKRWASRCREAFVERQHGRPTTRVARERWLLSYVAKYIKYALTLPLDPPSPSLGSHLLETDCLRLGPVGSTRHVYYCVLDIRDHEGERVTRRCRVTRSPSGREVGW